MIATNNWTKTMKLPSFKPMAEKHFCPALGRKMREVDQRGMPLFPLMTMEEARVAARKADCRAVFHETFADARRAAMKEQR